MIVEDLILTLERSGRARAKPCHRQIYEQIRSSILSGRLQPGDRLPATRNLAHQLGLARNTVARAYDDLVAEGYLESQVGSGTRVSPALAKEPSLSEAGARVTVASRSGSFSLSSWAQRALSQPADDKLAGNLLFDFRPGIPDWDSFPRTMWLRILGRALREERVELARYGEPGGYLPLRQAIARHLAISRGVSARAEQVIIVSGAQQALDLLIRLRLDEGDQVAMEDPGYPEARLAFQAAGASVIPLPVDDEGLVVDRLTGKEAAERPPRLVYVTPSHQFPTGATLSLARRLALLDWAGQRDTLIIEDDYDSEFRYAGRPVESLQGLDRAGRVVYMGTFSTVLFPPFRVGYLVLPEELVNPLVQAKRLADRQNATLEQIALARFIEEGHFERHLRRMRRLAAERRAALVAAIKEHLGVEVAAPETGMHLLLPLLRHRPRGAFPNARAMEEAIVARAAALGVGVYPLGPCCARPLAEPSVVLGYAALPEGEIREGIRRLAQVVKAIGVT